MQYLFMIKTHKKCRKKTKINLVNIT